jgi:hypothetical protein
MKVIYKITYPNGKICNGSPECGNTGAKGYEDEAFPGESGEAKRIVIRMSQSHYCLFCYLSIYPFVCEFADLNTNLFPKERLYHVGSLSHVTVG